jgi:hypothetical protein
MDDFERRAEEEQRRLIREAVMSMPKEDREALGLEGMGWKLKATGANVTAVILVAIAVAVVAFMVRDHDVRAAERSAHVEAEVKTVRGEVQSLAGRMEETTYVLTLTDDERKRLKLDMPESLRKRTGRDPR